MIQRVSATIATALLLVIANIVQAVAGPQAIFVKNLTARYCVAASDVGGRGSAGKVYVTGSPKMLFLDPIQPGGPSIVRLEIYENSPRTDCDYALGISYRVTTTLKTESITVRAVPPQPTPPPKFDITVK